jgi:hypothetical protein
MLNLIAMLRPGWRRLWEPHFRSFWHERGYFLSIQALPSTGSLGTPTSASPIEQPPTPMDRSSLYLQNLEKSSPLEPLCALTRHWNSQQIYTRATTHSRATSTSKLGVPSIISDKDNHHSIDHPPIYLSTVEKPPSEVEHASTRRLKSWGLCPRAVANPNLERSRTRAFVLRNGQEPPPSDSSSFDLSIGGGFDTIGGPTCRPNSWLP